MSHPKGVEGGHGYRRQNISFSGRSFAVVALFDLRFRKCSFQFISPNIYCILDVQIYNIKIISTCIAEALFHLNMIYHFFIPNISVIFSTSPLKRKLHCWAVVLHFPVRACNLQSFPFAIPSTSFKDAVSIFNGCNSCLNSLERLLRKLCVCKLSTRGDDDERRTTKGECLRMK